MKQSYTVNGKTLHLMLADITEMQVDAIVNAANEQLILGGGVAGAIRTKGGPEIQEACNRIGGTFVGGAVITTAGNLPAKHVIHAVGPRMGEGEEDLKLRNATRNSLDVAEKNQLESIAFPAISTGIFGFPLERCAKIMMDEVFKFLVGDNKLNNIYFCLWEDKAFNIFKSQSDRIYFSSRSSL